LRHLPKALSDIRYALGYGLAPLGEALLKLNAKLLDILYICG
jgi:glycine cleavage system protein P-like pyridoxal-binding family